MAREMQVRELTQGWYLKKTDTDNWLPVARVPTNVHLDLLDNGKIEDPFLGFNELGCQWVGEAFWTYRLRIPPQAPVSDSAKQVFAFDGLDTLATVKLNGTTILESSNMWVMHRVDVTTQLRSEHDNVLDLEFRPALLEARRVRNSHPEHKWICFNGEPSRLAVRKAQYHWGWDWGPVLMTCGPWRSVRLETYQARVQDLRVDYDIGATLKSVSGTIAASVDGYGGAKVIFTARLGDVLVFQEIAEIDHDGLAKVEFHVSEPKLWYPHGYGAQSLYTVTAVLSHEQQELHSVSKHIGFRQAELVQIPDEAGKSFYFRVNGIDVFGGGSNWIPADSFIPRLTREKYRNWLQLVVDGNQSVIRVWGGGVWEDDAFYDLCDELGILVWQDFMFACGNYPAFPDFLRSVEVEAVCQVKRLRHHPCIIIYAGNNEDYQVQEQAGLTYNYLDKDPQSWLKTDFPARWIYEKLLPEVVTAHSPHVAYHPGSPWGDGKATSDPTVGDMHQWNVWHGTQEKYQIFDTLGGRFNSEFGMEAFPHIETIKYYVTDPAQLYPQSRMMDFHNKAADHERKLATYRVENFRMQTDLEKFIHLTQLCQAEALAFAYRGWRRQWGQKRHCGGALVWQLNDCWPGSSWAIVDYFLRKKPAYYAMRRALASIAIAVQREHRDWSVVHATPATTSRYACWAASSKVEEAVATVELRFISISTGKEIKDKVVKRGIKLVPNGTTEILQGTIDHDKEEPHVLAARVWVNEEIVSRDVDWPQPLKYLDFSDRHVKMTTSGERITVEAAKPTKGFVFEEREGVSVQDSALDIVPGDAQVVAVHGIGPKDRPLQYTYLGAPSDVSKVS